MKRCIQLTATERHENKKGERFVGEGKATVIAAGGADEGRARKTRRERNSSQKRADKEKEQQDRIGPAPLSTSRGQPKQGMMKLEGEPESNDDQDLVDFHFSGRISRGNGR